ncbi:hypothetical protein [Bounagaea algeriensis]
MEIGYVISAEEQDPLNLVRNARRAEEVGFAYLSVSDHYEQLASEVSEDRVAAHTPCGRASARSWSGGCDLR